MKNLWILSLIFFGTPSLVQASHVAQPGERSVEERNRLERNIKERSSAIDALKEKIAREKEEKTSEQTEEKLTDTQTLEQMLKEQDADITALMRQDIPESYQTRWQQEKERLTTQRMQLDAEIRRLTKNLEDQGKVVDGNDAQQVSFSVRGELEKESWLPKRFFDKLQAWLLEARAYFTISPYKVRDIRASLDKVYTSLGDPINRFKNAQKLADISRTIRDKLKTHMHAFDIYTEYMKNVEYDLRLAQTAPEKATIQQRKAQAEKEVLDTLIPKTVTEMFLLYDQMKASPRYSREEKAAYGQFIKEAQDLLSGGKLPVQETLSATERAVQKAQQQGALTSFFKQDVQKALQALDSLVGTDSETGLLDRKGYQSRTNALHSKEYTTVQETLVFLESLDYTQLPVQEKFNAANLAKQMYARLVKKYDEVLRDTSLSSYEKSELTRQYERALKRSLEWQETLQEAASALAGPKKTTYSPTADRYIASAKPNKEQLNAMVEKVDTSAHQVIKDLQNNVFNAQEAQKIPSLLRTMVTAALHADPSQEGLSAITQAANITQDILTELKFFVDRARVTKKGLTAAQLDQFSQFYARTEYQLHELLLHLDIYQDALTQAINGKMVVLPQVSRAGAQQLKLSDRFIADSTQKETVRQIRERGQEAANVQGNMPVDPSKESIAHIKNTITAPAAQDPLKEVLEE